MFALLFTCLMAAAPGAMTASTNGSASGTAPDSEGEAAPPVVMVAPLVHDAALRLPPAPAAPSGVDGGADGDPTGGDSESGLFSGIPAAAQAAGIAGAVALGVGAVAVAAAGDRESPALAVGGIASGLGVLGFATASVIVLTDDSDERAVAHGAEVRMGGVF